MKKNLCILLALLVFSFIFPFAASAADPVPVESIVLNQQSATISIGKSINLKATISPKNATARKIEWTSSDESIATVRNGTVKGISSGTVTITAKATDESNITASAEITVVKPIKKITADKTKLTLAPDTAWKQTVSISPDDATVQTLTWTSSNESIATVDQNGIITAHAVGKCTIVGAAQDGTRNQIKVSLQVKEFDVVLKVSDVKVKVEFDTTEFIDGTYMQIGSYIMGDYNRTKVKFKNGCVKSSNNGELIPVKPGEDTVTVTVKHNDRKVISKKKYSVLVLPANEEDNSAEDTGSDV